MMVMMMDAREVDVRAEVVFVVLLLVLELVALHCMVPLIGRRDSCLFSTSAISLAVWWL